MSETLKRVERLISDNSPAILTGISAAGVVATALLGVRGGFRASEILAREGAVDRKEELRLTWKVYIPAASSAGLTVVSLVAAHQIGNRRAAALAVAYSITDKAFEEYRAKIHQQYGENKERAIRDSIAQDRVLATPPSNIILTEKSDVLCYESFTGRYFMSNMEALRSAENKINYRLLHENYVSLSDFYEIIGLPRTNSSDEVGWANTRLFEIEFSAVLSEDQKPCICISYRVEPVRDYYKIG